MRSLEVAKAKLEELKKAAENIPILEEYIEWHSKVFKFPDPNQPKPQTKERVIQQSLKPPIKEVKEWISEQIRAGGPISVEHVLIQYPTLGKLSAISIFTRNPATYRKIGKNKWTLVSSVP